MKDYTAIGTVQWNFSRDFFRGVLGGVSRAVKTDSHSPAVIFAREITKDEIHSRIQQEQPCGGGQIVKHHLNKICNTICCARRENTMIYVFQAIDNGAVHSGVEVQPERLGVPDGGGKFHHQLRRAPRMRTEDSDSK